MKLGAVPHKPPAVPKPGARSGPATSTSALTTALTTTLSTTLSTTLTTTLAGATATGLVEKLQTKEGQALVDQLVKDIARFAVPENVGAIDYQPKHVPGDRFDRAVVERLFQTATRPGEVRDSTQAAVVSELVRASSKGGVVDVDQLQKALGPKGVQFFQALAKIEGKSGDPLADRRGFDSLDSTTAKALAGFQPIAPKLSALDALVKNIAKQNELKGFQFMGLQHLFATSASMFEALHTVGVAHDDMHLIGKVYSTNHRVVAELEHKGATIDNVSKKVGSKEFAVAMEESIEHQLKTIIETLPQPTIFTGNGREFTEKPTPRVLLIDDGAEAIKILHEKFPDHAPFFVCVEQTRRGARILHDLEKAGKLKCPVANVAETWAKLEWESPMIGHSVVLEVDRKLDRLEKAGVPPAKSSLVVGCGAVGGGVARALLARGMEVHLYDKDPARSEALRAALMAEAASGVFGHDAAAKIHVHATKEAALPHAGVLVSCVGVRTLQHEDHDLLPDGAVLVNAASADDELGPQDLLPFRKTGEKDDRGNYWSAFRGKAVNTGKADAEAHSDAVVRTATGKELYVVNNGYVVNMTGERDPIPPRYIQLTRGLLFLGALTAKRAAEKDGGGVGVHDVPQEWQEGLVNLVQRELKKTGEDLKNPTWHTKSQDAYAAEEALTPPKDVVATAAAEARGEFVSWNDKLLSAAQQAAVDKAMLDAARSTGAVAGSLAVPTSPAPASDGKNRLYGYTVGPTKPGTPERQLAALIDGGDTLSLEGAALHKASLALGRHFNTQLKVSLKAPGLQSPLFVDKVRVGFIEGKVVAGGTQPSSEQQRFEQHFGHFTRVLTGSLLASRLKRAPSEEEVGAELKKLLANEKVDVTPWLSTLALSSDDADQRLHKALKS